MQISRDLVKKAIEYSLKNMETEMFGDLMRGAHFHFSVLIAEMNEDGVVFPNLIYEKSFGKKTDWQLDYGENSKELVWKTWMQKNRRHRNLKTPKSTVMSKGSNVIVTCSGNKDEELMVLICRNIKNLILYLSHAVDEE